MSEEFGHDTISAPVRSPAFLAIPPVVALRDRDSGIRFDLPFETKRWSIGKADHCDILVSGDPYVSNVHCLLERQPGGGLTIRDNESKNGTVVDATPIVALELRPGATIQVGKTFFVAVGARDPASAVEELRGTNPRFRGAVELALKAARSDCSVLVVGETGTGKDVIARAIHTASRRPTGPFVALNCGAFPRELIGSELFGHARGAFTGAVDAHEGLIVAADGGTLFLDEIGELELDLQPHLLRVLESREVRPIGGTQYRSVDVRFVAATNRLDGLGTKASRLRYDLYTRLAAVVVEMPPLRARKDDIPELVQLFMAELATKYGPRELLPSALDALLEYDWPGNVRELKQAIIRAVSLSEEVIDVAALRLPLHEPAELWRAVASPLPRCGPTLAPPPAGMPRHEVVLREVMASALARQRSIRAAAREIGMAKSTFAEKAVRYGLLPPSMGRRRKS
jgi:transcriptional regulator with PAS, ATPase and Fis domain